MTIEGTLARCGKPLMILCCILAVSLVFTVLVFPLIYLAATSLFDVRPFEHSAAFVGLANYIAVVKDARFIDSAKFTLLYSMASTMGQLASGLVMAFAIAQWRGWWQRALSSALMLPFLLVPSVVVVQIWRYLGDARVGMLTDYFEKLTGQRILMFSPELILGTLVLVSIWVYAPFVMLVMSSRLAQIPQSHLDVVALDGGGWRTTLRHVYVPQLLPAVAAVTALRFVLMATKFDLPYLLLGSGPASANMGPTSVYLYVRTYEEMNYGAGAAAGLIMALVSLVPVWFMLRRSESVPA